MFTCAKDLNVTLWFSENGQRVGTYTGHNGAVYTCDVTQDTERLITASADSTVRLWRVQNGEELTKIAYKEPCRAVSLSMGEQMAVVTTDAFMGASSTIHVFQLDDEFLAGRREVDGLAADSLTISVDRERITRAFFYDVNRQLITAHENGTLRR